MGREKQNQDWLDEDEQIHLIYHPAGEHAQGPDRHLREEFIYDPINHTLRMFGFPQSISQARYNTIIADITNPADAGTTLDDGKLASSQNLINYLITSAIRQERKGEGQSGSKISPKAVIKIVKVRP